MTRRTALNTLLSLAGVALFIWQIRDAGGIGTIRDGMLAVGLWWFNAILAISFGRFVLRSYAWRLLLNQPASLSAAVAATISGDALGNLTFLSLAASEPAKAVYLGRQVDGKMAFAALTAENFFYTVSIAIYIVIGAAAMLATTDHLPPNVRLGGVGALGLMTIGLAVAGWIALKRPALLSNLLSRLPSRSLAAYVDRVREFEQQTYGSAGPGAATLLRLTAAEVAFHALSYAESWLTLCLLTGQSLPMEALILDAVNRAVNVVFKLIPFQMGVAEMSAAEFAEAIGLDSVVGLQTALVRKVRMLAWAAVGIVIWLLRGRRA